MNRFVLLLAFLIPVTTISQNLPSVEEKTRGTRAFNGFINFYWDEPAGKIWLEVSKIDSEFLYVTSLPAAIGSNDIGLDRGLLTGTKIVRFNRVGRKLLLVQPNYSYRANSNDPAERKAVEQSFAQSVLWGFTIEAESNGRLIVDATDFFVRDAARAANSLRSSRQGNYSFDKSRSALYLPQCKNFPLNTEFEATITLVNTDGETGNYIRSVTPSSDAVTMRVHHSFVQLPDNNYKPRKYDPRSGYINTSYFDYSTPVAEPIDKHFIIRHRLEKKDPSALRSEAVEPIIYYLDNGTPEPIRSALLEGAKWWNQAFEAAGYINAFQVRILPADADPMDVRYNVINWVHRATRGWSYGNAVVDPRTGEIIKGHVSLGSLRVRQDYLIAQGLLAPFENGQPADDKMLTMALNRLKQLSAHEVGHTIGLMHNFAASVNNRASVMDYPHPAVKLNGKKLNIDDAYAFGIGEWDKLAVIWGYQDFPAGVNESAALDKILNDAHKAGSLYISDRDARGAGSLHPQAHLWDNGTDASKELDHVMKVREAALQHFGENNIRTGTPMAMLEDVLVPVYLFHRYQLEAASKLVGGQQYTYALRGDGQTATKEIPRTDQVKALQSILQTLDPSVLVLPERIARLIPPRPAGYEYTRELFKRRTGISFDQLSTAETAADLTLSLLFNADRLNRLAQSTTLSLPEVLQTMINSTWKAPRRKDREAQVQIQNEQLLLTYLLSSMVSENNSFNTKAILTHATNELQKFIQTRIKSVADPEYAGHLALALERIKKPGDAKPSIHAVMPPGAPIGCFDE